jgi:hypothetical protein
MEVIIYIIAYLVGAIITYIAHYYYIAYVYSKSKQIQSKYYFEEYVIETSLSRSLISCFWLFVVLLAPTGLVVYYLVKLIQNIIKKHFNIKL